jgi:hypothetical protein
MIPECKLFISRKTYKSADRYKNVRIGPTIKNVTSGSFAAGQKH